jgi:membrane fusion protein, multidrug efflux system
MKNTTLLLLAGVALVTACSKPQPVPEPVRAVKVMTVGVSTFGSGYEYSGEIKAQTETRLGFRVGGKITKRQAELGQRVKGGEVLAQIDPQDYRLAQDASRAQLNAAATSRDLADADFKRFAALKEQNFISGAELERRESQLKAAQAQYEQARSQLAVQGNQASYAVLTASAAGVITAVEAEPGQVVAAGTPVVRIALDGVRDVVFSVPEDKVAAFKPGMAVNIRSWTQSALQPATVREVSASADPATRTYQVKAAIGAGGPALPLGATVYVLPIEVSGERTQSLQVIKVPTSALRQQGKSSAVWVLDNSSMTVRSQEVQIATADGNDAVISAGLQPGMLVVSAGAHVLTAGQKVTIYKGNVPVDESIRAWAAPDSIAATAGPASAPASAPASVSAPVSISR